MRKRNIKRWYWTHYARVSIQYTSKGEKRIYAYVHEPISPYSFSARQRIVKSVEEGWAWIEEIAMAWADKNGVIFYG